MKQTPAIMTGTPLLSSWKRIRPEDSRRRVRSRCLLRDAGRAGAQRRDLPRGTGRRTIADPERARPPGFRTGMFRLRTFGGAALFEDDRPLTGPAVQRRRIALLALLAVVGDAGMSRDKLLA